MPSGNIRSMSGMSVFRRLVRNGATVAAVGLGGLVAQGYYAGHRKLPHLPDLECGGMFGDPQGVPIRIVALGDSALTGAGLEHPEQMWLRQAIGRLPSRYRIELQVFAQGGARARHIHHQQLGPALDTNPDIAVVSGGANDIIRGVPVRYVKRHLEAVGKALAQTACRVIFMGIGDMGSIPRVPQPLAYFLTYRSQKGNQIHHQMAQLHPRVRVLDMWDGISQAFRQDSSLFGPDLFHAAAGGHRLWADALYLDLLEACIMSVQEARAAV